MTERQERILKGILMEYIESARPVSSQLIEEKYDLDSCSATIRNEMQELSQKGFLHQPHISAGRVPTDKAYRFFVNDLLEKKKSKKRAHSELRKILEEERRDIINFTSRLSKFLARRSLNLAAIHLFDEGLFWKEGWGGVLREPESKEKEFTEEFINLLRIFEKNVRSVDVNTQIKIYIGRENPFTKAKNFSIMISKCSFPKNKKGIISLLGPKRMKYESNINLINSILEVLEKDYD